MDRRDLLKAALAAPFAAGFAPATAADAASATPAAGWSRVRPGDAAWPAPDAWEALSRRVGGRLAKLSSPFAGCGAADAGTACGDAARAAANPFWIGDQPALTQASGWADAWLSQPSAWAVAAANAADVAAAVDFAREHRLRLVVKGGGHGYQGVSSAPDSLLVWTRHMNAVTPHDAFVARGCDAAPQPAVSLGAGAMWIDAYDAVTTRGGRYVQGGGCTTVGVAGLVQSGGFGSFSKRFGTAAAGLLEAEVVTADGQVRVVNACSHPDLFWALKGGGGGSFGVVTRLTLRTHALPETFGAVRGTIRAKDDAAFRALLARVVDFHADVLHNPHWGEQIGLRTDNSLHFALAFQGLTQAQAEEAWRPLCEWLAAHADALEVVEPIGIHALPPRRYWDAAFWCRVAPGVMVRDDRPGAPAHHAEWAGDREQAGMFLHGYESAWLPARLLAREERPRLVDALFAATRHFEVGLHFNKGLAGAADAEIAAARDTATHPAVLDAFALAIIATAGSSAWPGVAPHAPDLAEARRHRDAIGRAMAELKKAAPGAGSYVSESDYYLRDWQDAFWGANHARLAAVKQRYDPQGLFFVRHGVGSEAWTDDGFTRIAAARPQA
ncbi:MAG: FAD-binding oxidoreductase [Burkholderiaceae bacterium]